MSADEQVCEQCGQVMRLHSQIAGCPVSKLGQEENDDMPIQIIPECRFCHTAIEPTEPMGAWTHTGLSIWCPGGGQVHGFTATPTIKVSKLGQGETK